MRQRQRCGRKLACFGPLAERTSCQWRESNWSKSNLTFRVRQERGVRLKDFILKRMFLPSKNPVMEVRALQDINLRIDQGDRVGFIGHNGAGKSTMLEAVGRHLHADERHDASSRAASRSLFDIALGFEGEANGWENIAYRSYLQGETPGSVSAKRQSHRRVQRVGRFPQHAGALLLRRYDGTVGVLDRHGHRPGDSAGG